MNERTAIYARIALSQVPRLLGLGNREEGLPTYGCFDRYYWHYGVLDVANARFQEVALLLALLYKYDFPGNRYYSRTALHRWTTACLEFWARLQRRDGSFDEVYPFEHSFVATAFSTYAVSEVMLQLGLRLHLDHVVRAGHWLAHNVNLLVSNQIAGAAMALYNIYRVTGEARFEQTAMDKVDQLLELQAPEGYFPEYDGYDIGYLSVCISYLAKYWQQTKDKKLQGSLQQAVRFINERLRPNGSYDYSVTSRRTQYLYPHGFRILGAGGILNKHLTGLERDEIINPAWMDNRFCLPLAIDYLQTYLEGFEGCK